MRLTPTQRALKAREALRALLELVVPDPDDLNGVTVQRGDAFNEAVRAGQQALDETRCLACRDEGRPDGCSNCGAKPW